MNKLKSGTLYEIELCSGERCRWQYLGDDARSNPLWFDPATGRQFRESSLLYAWQVIGESVPDKPA